MPFIHFNLLHAVDAGAVSPAQTVRDVAAVAELPLYWGVQAHYGSDFMGLPAEPGTADIVLALLSEAKVPYQVVDVLPDSMRHLMH